MRFLSALLLVLAAACSSQSTTNRARSPTAAHGCAAGRKRTPHSRRYYQRATSPWRSPRRGSHQGRSHLRAAYNMQALVFMGAARGRRVRARRSTRRSGCRQQPRRHEHSAGSCACATIQARTRAHAARRAQDTQYSSPEKAYLSAGLCLRRMGRNDEAEQHLRRAVLIRPT